MAVSICDLIFKKNFDRMSEAEKMGDDANRRPGDGPDNMQPLVGTPPLNPDKVHPPAGTLNNAQPPAAGNLDKTADNYVKPHLLMQGTVMVIPVRLMGQFPN